MTELPVGKVYRKVIRSSVRSAVVMLFMVMVAGFVAVSMAHRLAAALGNPTETVGRMADGHKVCWQPLNGLVK